MLYRTTMADEPLPPEVVAAFTKALKERSDKEIQQIQDRYDHLIKERKQIHDDVIKNSLQRARAADHQNIVKEHTLYRDKDIAELSKSRSVTIMEKKEDFPRELARYLKEQQEARKILKHLEQESNKESLKPDQPRR